MHRNAVITHMEGSEHMMVQDCFVGAFSDSLVRNFLVKRGGAEFSLSPPCGESLLTQRQSVLGLRRAGGSEGD